MKTLGALSERAVQPHIVRKGSRTAVAFRATAAAEASTYANGLSPELVEKFREDGFLALPGFASKQQVAAMMQRANELVEQWNPDIEARRFSVFTTKEEQSHAKVSSYTCSAMGSCKQREPCTHIAAAPAVHLPAVTAAAPHTLQLPA